MTKLPFISLLFLFAVISTTTHALGSGSTLAAVYGSPATVCGIVSGQSTKRIVCQRRDQNLTLKIDPNISFSAVAGGESFFCGLRSGGNTLLCWDTSSNSSLSPKRIYHNSTVSLRNITVGDSHVCASASDSSIRCWRGINNTFPDPPVATRLAWLTSGYGFSCGIDQDTDKVTCWGTDNQSVSLIESQFANISMLSLSAGGSHVCGLNATGFLICKGDNTSGQLDVPYNSVAYTYSGALALGANHSCATRRSNGSVVCWGGAGISSNWTAGFQFEFIVAGSNFTCGLLTSNFSVVCWGPGYNATLNLPDILPGPCVQSSCSECGVYSESQSLCSGSGNICKPCELGPNATEPAPPSQPPPSQPPLATTSSDSNKGLRGGLLAFAIIGSVGAFIGISTLSYVLWKTGVCFGNKKKIHNSVQPTITRSGSDGVGNHGNTSNNSQPSRSSTIRRQGSWVMRRQRSGTSSMKHPERAEEFTLSELAAATNSFSLENKIGAGSFGVVYKGKLPDGCEVAIKRGETASQVKKFQEKESAFDSELSFLSRLHHKHLVRLVGYCEEKDERLLVYDFMKNGSLYNHLHGNESSGIINAWKIRIKIALDAARGIEYLHNYAVPPIIHRDIKSSNILLDSNWTARVSDFGLSLNRPGSGRSQRPMKAAGTVGYIDPEYYGLNLLSAKTDVYGLGVVLLELLTGKRAIFKSVSSEDGGMPVSIVDYAIPVIMAGELGNILDERVGTPEINEGEAVELVAYTAMHCVHLEGKDRPTISDIVANLERALALCQHSHGSISSDTISILPE